MDQFSFKLLYQDKKTRARVGEIHTPHGIIHTPAFTPVGTQASVKSLTPDELVLLGTELFFVNTYHAYLRPGVEVITKAGGLHQFMNWQLPLITDSGGFQVFSLGNHKTNKTHRTTMVKITEDGVTFQSHWDGSSHHFTPEFSIQTQHTLGADIIIAFDECTPYPVTEEVAFLSMKRTHRWAKRSLLEHQRLKETEKEKPYQALYGVVQGSVFQSLREESARFISEEEFDGIAIGGVSVGESKRHTQKVCDWVVPILPSEKPRHLLGVGEIDDIFEIIERGIDTFDCVGPTRLARMGMVFIEIANYELPVENNYTIDITKKEYAFDMEPIDTTCRCYTCQNFTRAYLHHLFHVRELLAYRLATIHNVHFVMHLVAEIRKSIRAGSFLDLKKKWLHSTLL